MSAHKAKSALRRVPVLLAGLVVTLGAVGGGILGSTGGSAALAADHTGAPIDGVKTQPSSRVNDAFLDKPYVAPAGAVSASGVAGRLRIPALRISAPIDVTRLADGVFAVPNNTGQVGWLKETAHRTDLAGSSVIAGHVSNDSNVPGALWNLHKAKVGELIYWSTKSGRTVFKITAIHSYSRTSGVPYSTFTTTGPHTLHLVTCANRVVYPDGHWHYTNNLVVTAKVVS